MSEPTLFGVITADMARELAIAEKVCVRPLMRRVLDRDTNTEQRVPIPCGSTRETVCPPCANKARVLRIQQCTEGWHRTDEPPPPEAPHDQHEDQDDGTDTGDGDESTRRARSTKRRQDSSDLPRVTAEDRTVGRVFTAPDGHACRPSMFLTLTLPSYGKIRSGTGVPVDPGTYNYAGPQWTRCISRN